ncbi:ester cyclase [Schlegelella sp. S2-27]|uniref:Ester cyclase n=1 Tax=Caldimonas mangrovi TaxID=2944811 RepID=A0ABT0YS58_9BURK|nr:ester cyclase [Caldimonas mangrovi]MCM5681577.1 ester cyclase [Caldimonas mangrovi]
MLKTDLTDIYRDYIACLNRQDWAALAHYVHDEVKHNGNRLGVAGYREMLERDFTEIPDLHFNVELLVAQPPYVACRLRFNCTPRGRFLNLEVDGTKVSFTENVFYEFLDGRIVEVWSVIDKQAIEAQLRGSPG